MNDTTLDACLDQWSAFCDTLKRQGRSLLENARSMDEATQADGVRYLSRLARGGLEKFVEYDDPNDPVLYKVFHEKLKWAGDNPDSIYSISSLDGNNEYLIRGNRGSVNYFNFTAMNMGADGSVAMRGFLDCVALKTDANGDFSLFLSAKKPDDAANWLAISPDTNSVMIRQTFMNRHREKELTAGIKLLSDSQQGKALTLAQVLKGVAKAEAFFEKSGATFVKLSQVLHGVVNQLPAIEPEYIRALGGDPNYVYFGSAFAIKPGQALLIHLPWEPVCETWSLCLHNYWLESLDYHKSTINLSKHTASKNPDGSITLVVSMVPPGVDNWLDSCDHPMGQMLFRWTKTQEVVAPQTKLVELADVDWDEKLRRWPDS